MNRRLGSIALRVTALNVQARLQYRTDFLLALLNGVMWQASVLVFLTVLVTRFPGLGGWSSRQVLFIAALRLVAHALYVCLFSNVVYLPIAIQEGRIDGYLLRPLPLLTQVLLSSANVNAVGDLCVAGTLFVIAVRVVPVDWTAPRLCFLILAIVGAVLLEAAVQLAISALSLRHVDTFTLSGWIDEIMASFGNYPGTIFPTVLRIVFVSVVPLAYTAYLPAGVLLRKPTVLGCLSPAIGVLAFVLVRRVWYASIRHYQGVGG
jgi:ABC-2 type transport system permease protein